MDTAAVLIHTGDIGRGVSLGQTQGCIFPKIAFGFHKSLTALHNLRFVHLKNLRVLDLLQNEFLGTFSLSKYCGTPRPGKGIQGV